MIAGIVIYINPDLKDIQMPDIYMVYRASDDKIAGVLDEPTVGEVEHKVNIIRKIPGVLNVSYAYMNIEDLMA